MTSIHDDSTDADRTMLVDRSMPPDQAEKVEKTMSFPRASDGDIFGEVALVLLILVIIVVSVVAAVS